jgi:hypothetical protein
MQEVGRHCMMLILDELARAMQGNLPDLEVVERSHVRHRVTVGYLGKWRP